MQMVGRRTSTLAADFNNDGKVDLYVSGCINLLGIGHPLNCSRGILYESLGGGKFREHQDNGLLPTVVEFSSSASDVNGDGLLDLYIAEGLPFGNNVELIGQFTSKLYINKVRSKNHGIPSMDHYVAICCWCQQWLAMQFDRAPGATHGDSLPPPVELRTEEWLATNC